MLFCGNGNMRLAVPGVFLAAMVLVACTGNQKPYFVAASEPWRDDKEAMCIASLPDKYRVGVSELDRIDGPSVCGALHPFEVTSTANGSVSLSPAATLRCSMIPALDEWVTQVVQPAAMSSLGSPVAKMQVAASYACRPRNNIPGGKLSEHGYANAIDISYFTLADGRTVSVEGDWEGSDGESAFLKDVHEGACGPFTTVLGPEADAAHKTHFHFDLASRGRDGRTTYCR